MLARGTSRQNSCGMFRPETCSFLGLLANNKLQSIEGPTPFVRACDRPKVAFASIKRFWKGHRLLAVGWLLGGMTLVTIDILHLYINMSIGSSNA